jgi:hypothetical protein
MHPNTTKNDSAFSKTLIYRQFFTYCVSFFMRQIIQHEMGGQKMSDKSNELSVAQYARTLLVQLGEITKLPELEILCYLIFIAALEAEEQIKTLSGTTAAERINSQKLVPNKKNPDAQLAI